MAQTEPDYSVDRDDFARFEHELNTITLTKGGHRVKPGLMYAATPEGKPMGIVGDIWRNRAYRWHTWDDNGVSTRSRDPGCDLPFAPERENTVDPALVTSLYDSLTTTTPVETPFNFTQHNLTFGVALDALLTGKKISRAIWQGHWFLASAEYRDLPEGIESAAGLPYRQGAVIVAALRDGTFAPAQPYQADLLATDWLILD